MKYDVPFFANHDDDLRCFQVSLRMVLKYFLPDRDFSWKELDKMTARLPGRLRFSALRRQLVGVSEGVLINQLKDLERAGIIRRIVFKEIPPHVEYELTARGKALERSLQALNSWGAEQRSYE